jgi:hypothetical protein
MSRNGLERRVKVEVVVVIVVVCSGGKSSKLIQLTQCKKYVCM